LLAELGQQLEKQAYAPEAQARLVELEAALAAIGYEAAAHESARIQRLGLVAAPERFQALRQAEAALKPLRDSLADLERRLEQQEEATAELARQHEEAAAQLALLEEGAIDLEAVEREVFRLREEAALALQAEVAARLKVQVLNDLRAQQESIRESMRKLNKRAQEYQMLEKAFGRNGVQALLIEHARPEIEDRANELLYRLSGGAMQVSLETQRQLKSRDAMAETLEIKISDGAGIRPYENYSGGEKFRVNFAIRLALSQVLAKRAGARLQTLVIDEGFGSQDPEGRQRLVEAINTIQKDFACILIITHVEELRDAFPTRIEVEKTAAGSRVTVV
jgi:exonuclease SbcC